MKKLIVLTSILFFGVAALAQEAFSGKKADAYFWNYSTQEYEVDYQGAEVDLFVMWEYSKSKSMVLFVDGKFNEYEKIRNVEFKDGIPCYDGSKGSRLVYYPSDDVLVLFANQDSNGRYKTMLLIYGYYSKVKYKTYKKTLKPYKHYLSTEGIKL